MAARETHQHGLHMLDFFSADSNARAEPIDREVSAFQEVVRPPPVALSLRTRESSALALKRIFDQIYSSAESTPNTGRPFEKKDMVLSSAFQTARTSTSPLPWQASSNNEDPRMCLPDLDTSLAKSQQSIPSDKIGMGAPGSASSFLQNVNFPVYQGTLPQAMSRPGSSSPSLKQPTAQLTIFYSGTVNVYDDVPADKANAIMLLAGTGSSKQSGEGEKEKCMAKLSLPLVNSQMGMSRPVASPMTPDATGTAAMTGGDKNIGFNTPFTPQIGLTSSVNTVSPPPLSSPAPSMSSEFKQQAASKRPHAGIELPHARKASLARFLEKRKDRVLVKQQPAEAAPQSEEKGWEMTKDERPSSPKKPCLMASVSSSSSPVPLAKQ